MSNAKICDSLTHTGDFISRIFSDEDANWASGLMGVRRRNPRTGQMEVKEFNGETCPRCMAEIDARKRIMEEEIQKEIEAGIQSRYGPQDTVSE